MLIDPKGPQPPVLTAEFIRARIAEAQEEQREHLAQANAQVGIIYAYEEILPMVEAAEQEFMRAAEQVADAIEAEIQGKPAGGEAKVTNIKDILAKHIARPQPLHDMGADQG